MYALDADNNVNDETKSSPHRRASSMSIAGEVIRDKKNLSDKVNRMVWDNVGGNIEINNRRVYRPEKVTADGKVGETTLTKKVGLLERVNKLLMMSPMGWRKFAWDMISGIAILYSAVEVPFLIGFLSTRNDDYPALTAADFTVTAIFAVDIFISFSTPYQDAFTNKYVYDRWKISKQYVKLWFWIDCLATIPFDSLATLTPAKEAQNASGVRLVRLLRLFRLMKLLKFSKKTQAQIKEIMEKYNLDRSVLSGFVLLVQIFFVAHLFGCFWFFIAQPIAFLPTVPLRDDDGFNADNNYNVVTWTTNYGFTDTSGQFKAIQDSSLSTQYIAAMYWTFFTLLTVGYGDIHPTNTGERFYALMTMIMGSLMFGAIIAKVREVIESRNLLRKEVALKEEAFKGFLEDKKLSKALKLKAKEAYAYYVNMRPNLAESGLYDELPKLLSIRLVEHTFVKEIHNVHIFRDCPDRAFVAHMISHSRPYAVKLGEVVYQEGDIAECMSFIVRGAVQMARKGVQGKERLLGYAFTGNYFGDAEFYKRSLRLSSYQAVRHCTLYSVDFTDVQEAVDEHFDAGLSFMNTLKKRYYAFEQVRHEPPLMSFNTSRATHNEGDAHAHGHMGDPHKPKGRSAGSDDLNSSAHGSVHGSMRSMKSYRGSVDGDSSKDSKMPSTELRDKGVVDKRRRTKLLGTKNVPTNIYARKVKGNNNDRINGVSMFVDGEYFVNESVNDAMASVAPTHLAMNTQSNDQRYPCVVGINNYGKDDVAERTMAYFYEMRIFHPTHRLHVIWDLFLGSLIVYSFIVVPMQMAFDTLQAETGDGFSVVDYAIDCIFAIDICANLNTAFYSDEADAYILSRGRIAEHYVGSGWMAVDIVSCLPLDVIITTIVTTQSTGAATAQLVKAARAIRLVRLLKLVKIVKVGRYMDRFEEFLDVSPAMINLLVTLVQVIFISHLVACMWWGVCSVLSSNAWYDHPEQVIKTLGEASFQDQYVAALYWTITTLTTTGYGDIYPVNNSERVLNVMVMVISATVFGYVVANISNIVRDFNSKEQATNGRIGMLKEYLLDTNCPKSISQDVLAYFRQTLQSASMTDDNLIVRRLPFHLRMTIRAAEHTRLFETIPIFRHIKNDTIKVVLVNMMTFCHVLPGHRIVREKEAAMEMVFLTSGRALIGHILPNSYERRKQKAAQEEARTRPRGLRARFMSSMKMSRKGDAGPPMEGIAEEKESSPAPPLGLQSRSMSKQGSLSRQGSMSRQGSVILPTEPNLERRGSLAKFFSAVSRKGSLASIFVDNSEAGDDDDDGDGGDVKAQAKKIERERREEQKRIRARSRWQKVRESLPQIVAIGRDPTNCDGIVGIVRPTVIKVNVFMNADVQAAHNAVGRAEVAGLAIAADEVEEERECEVLGELHPGDVFGFHAMRLSVPQPCTVVAMEPCAYYSLRKVDLLTLTNERPDVAFEIQMALGATIHEADSTTGREQLRKKRMNFMIGARTRFQVTNQTAKKKVTLQAQMQMFSKMSKEDKLKIMERFRLLAEQNRRQQSMFAPFYRVWELAYPLEIPDIDVEGNLAAASRNTEERKSLEDRRSIGDADNEDASRALGASAHGTSSARQDGAPPTGPPGADADVMSTPSRSNSLLKARMQSVRGKMLSRKQNSSQGAVTTTPGRSARARRPVQKKPLAVRLENVVRLEELYDEYLATRLAAKGLSATTIDDADDVDDGFAKFCAEKLKKRTAVTELAAAAAAAAASSNKALEPSQHGADDVAAGTAGAPPELRRQTSVLGSRLRGASIAAGLRNLVDAANSAKLAALRAERTKMALLKRDAVLVRHRSYEELYDMWGTHRMFEMLPTDRHPRARAASFPQ